MDAKAVARMKRIGVALALLVIQSLRTSLSLRAAPAKKMAACPAAAPVHAGPAGSRCVETVYCVLGMYYRTEGPSVQLEHSDAEPAADASLAEEVLHGQRHTLLSWP